MILDDEGLAGELDSPIETMSARLRSQHQVLDPVPTSARRRPRPRARVR